MPVGEVLQSTTPILLCTTTCYSSTTPYCKVLLQYYPVLQSTTPVLLCFTKYYNILLQHYKVLFQYYSLLQRTSPVLPLYYKIRLQYYSVLQSSIHDWSASHMKRHLQCAEQQASSSNFPKYCACHEKWVSGLILLTFETSIYHARSNKRQPPPSQNTAPATRNESHDWSASHVKRHLQCAVQESASNFTKYCACHGKWISWSIRLTHETSFTIRRASKVTVPTHQVLHLPRKMNLIIDPPHIWNVTYNARNNRRHPPTSPNTAPATKNESQDWSCSHLKRHLPCAEQQHSPSNLTK